MAVDDPFNVADVSKGVANQYNSAASQNLSGKGFGKNPGELYDWNEVTAPQSTSSMPSLSNAASRVGTQLGVGTLSAFTGVPSLGINAVVDFLDAKDRFSLDNVGALVSKAGIAALGLTGFPGMIAGAVASQIDPASQQTRDRNLGVYNTSFLGRALRSPVPNTFQHAFFGQRDIEDRTLNTEYEDIEGVKGTSWDSWETSMDGPGGTPDPNSYDTISTSTLGLGALDRDDTDMGEPDSYGEAETETDYDDYDDDYFAGGGYVGYEHGGMHLADLADQTLYERTGTLGDFAANEKIIASILPNLGSDEKINQTLAFDNVVREEYPFENYPGLNFNQHLHQKLKSALPGSQLNYQGEVESSDKNYQGLLNLGLLAQEQRGREAVATYDFKNTFKFSNVPEFMKKIVIDPKLNVGIAGQISLMDMNQPSSKTYTGGIGAKFLPGVSDTGVNLSAVSNPSGITPTVTVDQSMGPVNAQYQRIFKPNQPDFSKFNASVNVPVGDASVTGSYEQQGMQGVSPVRNYNIAANIPVNEANLAAKVARNPGSDTINLGLSGIDFLGGKAALSAEKTFNSTGENPRKVGATWKKQVGDGEIEVQASINNQGPGGSVTFRQGKFEAEAGVRDDFDRYGTVKYNVPL